MLYCYPEEITDRLLDTMRADKICSYVDSPFQHADPTMVRKMRRGLDGTRALRLISKIRDRLPDAALRTSLIVGFPGEGPTEFAHLKEFVREAQFDHLGVFTYSHESDAPCASLEDTVPMREKEDRRQEIMEIQAGISAKRIERYVGARVPVLLEGRLQGTVSVGLGVPLEVPNEAAESRNPLLDRLDGLGSRRNLLVLREPLERFLEAKRQAAYLLDAKEANEPLGVVRETVHAHAGI